MSLTTFVGLLQSAVVNTIYLVFTVIAFLDLLSYDRRVRRRQISDLISNVTFRPISVIVPAFNEQKTIVSNVNSMLGLAYPEFEVIVVNDGSVDDTLARLQTSFSLFPVPNANRQSLRTKPVRRIHRSIDYPNLVVIDKENGGKSDALNAGINVSSYPLFCSIDADSLLESDALLRIAKPFVDDDRIVAAGGIVRVINGAEIEGNQVVGSGAPKKLIHFCQAIEYVRGFLTGRAALARINSLLIISGAFGLFLKQAVIEVGGYSSETVCEDMEIVVRLQRFAKELRRPWRVIFLPDPVCWTQVPSDYRSLMRQRDRWQRGLIESILLHFRMFMNPQYGSIGMFGMPFYFFFEALGPVVELIGYIAMPLLWSLGLLDFSSAVMFFVLAVLYNLMLSLLALVVEDLLFQRYERATDLLLMMSAACFEFLGYRQILTFRRAAAFATVLFRRGQWGHVTRERFVTTSEGTAA